MNKETTPLTRHGDDDTRVLMPGKPAVFQVVGNILPINFKVSVTYGKESTIQILYKNNSDRDKELRDYQTMQTNYAQLSIINKFKLPLIIRIGSEHTFDITIKGRYLGESNENVDFFFKNTVQKVQFSIDVTDKRLKMLHNVVRDSKAEVDIRRLYYLINYPSHPGVRKKSEVKHKKKDYFKIGTWDIPHVLWDCYKTKNQKSKPLIETNKLKYYFPAVFEHLTYQNYQTKFNVLLHLDELEVLISFQIYAQENVHFTKHDGYLVLKIPNLSKQRPTLIPNDGVLVTCSTGDTSDQYQGFIHQVINDEIWLVFNKTFYHNYGQHVYNVIFFNNRMSFLKLHEVIKNFLKNNLSEAFLFPKFPLEYQPPKLKILNEMEIKNTSRIKVAKKKKNRPKEIEEIRWVHDYLNHEQKSAVINILKGEGRPMPYIIYGPPGTGKTITLTESIIQVYKNFSNSKLLICAPTNAAAHLLLGKLIKSGSVEKTVLKRLVNYHYFNGPFHNKEYNKYCIVSNQDFKGNGSMTIKPDNILKLKIIVTTVYTASTLNTMGFERGIFSHIFIDEAGQAMEPEILFPISFLDKSNQVILAGDPKQLPPVVKSMLAKKYGLGQSMLARFIDLPKLYERDCDSFPEYNGFNPKIITHLVKNYRSLPEIVEVFSSLFYENIVKATKTRDDEAERIDLDELNRNALWKIGCNGPVIVHGVRGVEFQESTSWYNPHEALHAFLYFEKLLESDIFKADDIGIITPYVSQVAKINVYLKRSYPVNKLPKVSSVELFQGQERKVIIISLVRSAGNAGFIASEERINVAMSRAKSLVIVIGNPSTMSNNRNWKEILEEAKAKKNYVGCNPYS